MTKSILQCLYFFVSYFYIEYVYKQDVIFIWSKKSFFGDAQQSKTILLFNEYCSIGGTFYYSIERVREKFLCFLNLSHRLSFVENYHFCTLQQSRTNMIDCYELSRR